jgi:apolipoprotein N-acyltransferase
MIKLLDSSRAFRWLFAIISGCLMVVSFPETGSFVPLTFISWVPLLLLDFVYHEGKKSWGLFFQAYLTFFIYNVGTTWWIYNASPSGAYMAFFANSLLMAITFIIFHKLKRKFGKNWLLLIFLTTWISFEFLHFHWELSWPWLTFGNVFASTPFLVQWYSITGVLGGSIWILTVNALIAMIIIKGLHKSLWKSKRVRFISLLILIPISISLVFYFSKSTVGKPYEIVVVQPNIDPYNTKFSTSNEVQLEEIMQLADKKVSKHTQLVIAPETALYPNPSSYSDLVVEDDLVQKVFYHKIMERKAKWHGASFLIGASTYRFFNEKNSPASSFNQYLGMYEENYNSSVLFNESRIPSIIHKSKLVLGVEKIPFIHSLPFLEKFAIEMGGGSGTLGIETEPKVMQSKGVTFAPVVCYESIYGGFMAKQSRKDAEFIAIITNDGWWGNTPGYRQHFKFAALRAIENNKWVVRSANTGTSGVFNNRGDLVHATKWWVKDAFSTSIQLNERKTIYNYLGDFLGYFAVVGFVTFLGMRFIKGLHLKK